MAASFVEVVPYKCAGIIPYRRRIAKSGRLVTDILLGTEVRADSYGEPVWNFLSGRRELTDNSPQHTAMREFWEESGKCLSAEWQTDALRVLDTVVAIPYPGALMYPVSAEHLFTDMDICAMHADAAAAASCELCPMQQLAWICTDSIRFACTSGGMLMGYSLSQFVTRIGANLCAKIAVLK
jgi:hypothetical protein